MSKRAIIGLCILTLVCTVQAEVVVLQSGMCKEGNILLQNEDIVMLQDNEGRKFQFPRTEVTEIRQSEQITEIQPETIATSEKGNCALRLDFSGGGLFVPSLRNGGFGAVDIQIGTRHIGSQSIFLGGSVGYELAAAGTMHHFLPLMVVVSVPLIEGKHAPELGAALGYGFAIKSPTQGGMAAKLDASWRYQYNASSALLLGVQARFQQANVRYMEVVNEQEYASTLGRNFVSVGLRLALEF